MSDTPTPVIRADDAMLPLLVLQHDLRERFFHALTQIIVAAQENRPYDVLVDIAHDATDAETIQRWIDDGRPMPWFEAMFGDAGRDLERRVLKILE